jgi:CheY-like chemotaxis protein
MEGVMHETFSHIDPRSVEVSDLEAPLRPEPPKPQLLIVDDDFSCAHYFSHAASECGYQATITRNGDQFRSEYKSSQPEAVLLDLSLPETDGVELLRFLAEHRCTAKVILTSGVGERVLEAAMRLGQALGLRMGKSLPKPFVIQDLADALSSAPGAAKEGHACFR